MLAEDQPGSVASYISHNELCMDFEETKTSLAANSVRELNIAAYINADTFTCTFQIHSYILYMWPDEIKSDKNRPFANKILRFLDPKPYCTHNMKFHKNLFSRLQKISLQYFQYECCHEYQSTHSY